MTATPSVRRSRPLPELEMEVMKILWHAETATVGDVQEQLKPSRPLAYTTVMTVLQRLAKKGLVVQLRDDRAHRYAPVASRDDLVAGLMVDALDQAADLGGRRAALMNFVERVGTEEADTLRHALAELDARQPPR